MLTSLCAICLVSLVVGCLGKLAMIYQPSDSADHISLTCESEDDRAALVWNHDLEEPSSKPRNFSTIFPSSTSKCAIIASSGCIVEWEESSTWRVVDSIDYPMGPVFDSRWEDFEEHSYPPNNWSNKKNITNSGSIVFSFRGSGDIFAGLCKESKASRSYLRITTTNHSPRRSAIYPCDMELFESSSLDRKNLYTGGRISRKYSEDKSEWRTFILKWNIERKRIRVYKNAIPLMNTHFNEGNNVALLFVGNGHKGQVKFHFYKYFLTTKKNAKLTTLEFDHKEPSFCIELLVSLCLSCTLNVRVVNRKGFRQTIGSISGDGPQSTYVDLPAWRVVKLNANLSVNHENPIRLEILTHTTENYMQGRWAIDSIRKCVPVDAVRSISSLESFTSNIQCQKLSYTENSVVESNAPTVGRIFEKLRRRGFSVKAPDVRNITASTALLYYPLYDVSRNTWDKLRYKIKTENSSWIPIIGNTTKSQNPEYHVTLIDQLSPGTSYTVKAVVRVNYTNYLIELDSMGQNFSTHIAQPFIAMPPIHPIVDMDFRNPHFLWLISFPVIMIYVLVVFVVRRRRQNTHTQIRSLPSIDHTNDIPLSVIEISDDWQLVWNWDDRPYVMKFKKIEDYSQRAIGSGELELQFKMLPRGMIRPCQYGNLPINKSKNRSKHLIAYDETRVILGEGSLGLHSDYINANYIQGYCKEKAYIATQGPTSDTVVDFWRMVWQEEVRVICMLVNVIEDGKIMCEQYWPEVGETVEYGHITISNLDQRVYAHYTYRTFQLSTRYGIESRKVKHLQYTAWPEQWTPMYSYSIVEYLNELLATPPGPGPIVVHCSTGAGRTGTIILCDISLRHVGAEEMVDFFVEAKKMYNARANMLDNLQQYLLAHLMPTQCLLLPSTKLFCSNITAKRIEELKNDLPAQMQRLAVFSWKDKVLRHSKPQRLPHPEHIAKIRFPRLMPVGQSLVTLKRYPPHKRSSDYICAVYVDGVRAKAEYIASQLPLPSTLSDCWRLIAEKKIELVIILQCPGPEDLSCVEVIPRETTPFIPVPYIKVEHRLSYNDSEHFTMDELLLTDSSGQQAEMQYVTVLTCSNWSLADNAEPPPPEALVALWSVSQSVSRAKGPTLVLCRDGVTGCGLYLALSFLLEKMAVEQEFDVILAVRAIRQSRPEFINSKAQFEYLYDAAVKYLEGFETYANFT